MYYAYIVSCFQIGNFVAFTFQVHPRLKMPSSDFWHLYLRMRKYPRNFKASRNLSTCFHLGNVAFSLHPSVTRLTFYGSRFSVFQLLISFGPIALEKCIERDIPRFFLLVLYRKRNCENIDGK